MKRTAGGRGFLFSLFFSFLAALARGQENPDQTLSPYFLVESGEASAEAFPLKSTLVEATINGVIADVTVVQTYSNSGSEPINARYLFPGSTRASVYGMKITVGDHAVVAKIKEREQAKKEFVEAKAQGKSASLLEQHRPNVFSMSVANILPMDRVEVELHYTELLIPSQGTYQFVYPAVVGPRYSNHSGEPVKDVKEDLPGATQPDDCWVSTPTLREKQAPVSTFDIRVNLATGIPLQEVHTMTHATNVQWLCQDRAEITLAPGSEPAGNRDFILEFRLAGKEIQSGLLLYQGKDENFFLLTVQPPEQIRAADIPPREYIFVLDVSGSMSGFPLETAKSLIRDLIGRLRPTDLFDVVLFSGDSRLLSPASLPASEKNVALAIRLIDGEGGGGGTELGQAIETTLRIPQDERYSRSVVVITDGFIEAEQQVFELISKNLNRTNFFSFGIGSGVNRYLLEGIAKAGRAESFVVTSPKEAADSAQRFRDYIQSPLLTDLRVSYQGFEVYDVEPPALPDLFAQRPIVLFGKWRGRPEGSIEITGEGGAGPFSRRFVVSETRPLEENRALRQLWARERIARLSDFNFGGEDAESVKEVTSLGLRYSLLTKHTSFIAVIEQVRNPSLSAKDVDQPLPLPQGVSEMAVGASYGMGPEPEMWILLGLAGILLSTLVCLRRRRQATI
jgi:Ca-activated chloride channel family protein